MVYSVIPKFRLEKNMILNNNKYHKSAIADKLHYSVCKLWQKYKRKKHPSNIALSYGAKIFWNAEPL